MGYILDLSVDEGQSFVGVITNAVMIEKYHEMGDPDGPPIPKNWKGLPGIRIKRDRMFDEEKEIVFRDKESRDRVFVSLKNQIYGQANQRRGEI